MASEAIAGRPSGMISRRKILISLAPSIRADSRMSLGIPMKKFRSRKIANGSPKATWKRMIPMHRVEQAERVVEPEHRDQRHLHRHDEQADDDDEDPVAAGEVEPGERVAGQRADRRSRAACCPTAMYAVVLSASIRPLSWRSAS